MEWYDVSGYWTDVHSVSSPHRFSTAFLYQKEFITGNKGFYSCFNWFCFHKIWIYGYTVFMR